MNDKDPLHLPTLEHRVLDFWRDQDVFAEVVAARQNGKPFVFYDGPPFTTGLPHYGHILQMAIKDAVLRYQTMQGYNVPRKIGWDTHGLPVEFELEKELNLSGKRAIEAYGIDKFVAAARGIVLRCTTQWKTTMERMGRWVDTSHPYTTMDNDYIESVWWALSELHKKDLLYKDYRVSPYCPRCGTVLSNFEVNQGYQDNVSDTSVYVSLRITTPGKFADGHLVFWTTTPWTIPAVGAMSVNPGAAYQVFRSEDRVYIMAKERVADLFESVEVIDEVKGEELIGQYYLPPYDVAPSEGMHRVVAGAHVTVEDGTGIASIAPAYGEIDALVGKEEKIPAVQTIDPDGTIKKDLGLPGEGLFVKEGEKAVVTDLKERGFLVLAKQIKHTYPFCWRCSSPLLYYPTTSWFVKVTALQDVLLAENKKINWQPEHLRDGRFGRWLEGARDWAISRDRYWGAPMPIWECSGCDAVRVVSSRDELKVNNDFDLHRPSIDTVTLPCACGQTMRRVPFVFDCWFESGSMSFAQHHYPFESKDAFIPESNTGYPADFIAEALDQTRGWFYTLHVLGVALFGKRAFGSVVVSGLLLAPDGKKLSKSLRNYTDPHVLMDEQGVEALRLFLFTATTLGEDYRFSDTAVSDVKRRWLVPLLNVLQYYRLSSSGSSSHEITSSHHAVLDQWIKARVVLAQNQVTEAMAGREGYAPYDLVQACRTFGPLVEDLSTWYVRLSRGREDKAFVETLHAILLQITKIYAPFLPFVTEHIYQAIKTDRDPVSVHLCLLELPSWEDDILLESMSLVRRVVSMGRDLRVQNSMPLRQPLAKLTIAVYGNDFSEAEKLLIAQELQVEKVETQSKEKPEEAKENFALTFDFVLTDDLKQKGQVNVLRRAIQDLRKQARLTPGDQAQVFVTPLESSLISLLETQLVTTKVSTTQPSTVPLAEATVDDIALSLYSTG